MDKIDYRSKQNEEFKSSKRSNWTKILSNCSVGVYIYLPVLAFLIWFFGLMTLLWMWVKDGRPRYRDTQASIAFISSVGAAYQTLFICICLSVISMYFPTICLIKMLRHKGRLPKPSGRKEQIFSWLAIFFCGIGCIGLLVLAAWNCWDYETVHWFGTFMFIIGVSLSAIFQTAEVWCLKKEHPDRKHLKRNGILKLIVVTLPVILASVFGGFYSLCGGKPTSHDGKYTPDQCEKFSSTAAILEWSIAFSLNLYFITLILDLWPSRRSSPRYVGRDRSERAKTKEVVVV